MTQRDIREPTEFGWFLMQRMAAQQPPISQSELGRAAGVSQSTISRWIYEPIRPDAEKLRLVAPILGVSYADLLHRAGYGEPAAANKPQVMHLLAGEINIMLSDTSPIPPGDRAALETLLDRAIEPYRRLMRPKRRRSA